ncbi:right-handed parallel beta-helix repeat-containing protein, partial [Rhodopirellula sp.]|nr:right-handed parallel beta-helix repeat-containing protein [Rhodopirellula sp.]
KVCEKLVNEIESAQESIAPSLADPEDFTRQLDGAKIRVVSRTDDIKRILASASVSYTLDDMALTVFATAPATLKLEEIEFEKPPVGITVFEDRDFNGALSEGDRELSASIDGTALVFQKDGVDLFPGRDFRASYHQPYQPDLEAYAAHREYTRLAALPSVFLLHSQAEEFAGKVVGLSVRNPLTDRFVVATQGRPVGMITTETVHPWSEPPTAEPTRFLFKGVVDLLEDMLVDAHDTLTIEPGTTMRMGAGVSIVCRAPVALDGVRFERLSADKPWGVVALQGGEASSSRITNCEFSGGSDDTIAHVYYSGMLSVHMADNVVLSQSKFARNIIGDDTVRFADCENVLIDGVEVTDANGDAIDCDISSGLIRNTDVINPQNDGIDLMTAMVNLENVRVRGAGDKGISFGENASPLVTGCKIRDCVIGVAFKDGSDPILENVLISNCRTGVSGYAKNWRYPGGGRGKLIDCTLEKNGIDVLLDELSSLVLERCLTENKYRIPASRIESLFEINPRKANE